MRHKVVALIPARAGSKGVPKKNIKLIGGFPLIAYSIIASKLSQNINEVIVSTDSKEIAKIAKKFNANVPFIRPRNISKDKSTDIEYIKHAIDWYQKKRVNDLIITMLPAIHWSKRTPMDKNKTLWGSFLIEYKGMKLFFSCDTGYGNIYKELGEKFGPIDLVFINIGAYDFRPMFEKSIYHTTPEEALNIAQDLKSKKVLGMHWGTVLLSLEDPFEPPIRFKNAAGEYGFGKNDAILLKIGESKILSDLLEN